MCYIIYVYLCVYLETYLCSTEQKHFSKVCDHTYGVSMGNVNFP